MPVSDTVKTTSASRVTAFSVMRPPGSVYCVALSSKFCITWAIWSASPTIGCVSGAISTTIRAPPPVNLGSYPATIRGSNAETVRGLIKFDEFGNAIGNVYIRKVTRSDGRLVNSIVKTYPDVSQFWTYDKIAFLKNPVYSRDYPPAKNLEQ